MKTPLTDQWTQACKAAWKIWLAIFTVSAAMVTLGLFLPELIRPGNVIICLCFWFLLTNASLKQRRNEFIALAGSFILLVLYAVVRAAMKP